MYWECGVGEFGLALSFLMAVEEYLLTLYTFFFGKKANYVADFESGLPNGGCLTPDGNGVDTVWKAVWQDDGLNVVLAVHS